MRWWILPLSVALCVAQAVATILAANLNGVYLTPTLISVLAFGVLFVTVLVINPLLGVVFRERLLRPLSRAELISIFTALLVTSGVSTFGLTSQVVPMIAAPWNPEWNTAQRGWDEDVLPALNPALFLTIPADGTAAEQDQARQVILDFRRGVRPRDAAGRALAQPPEDAPLWGEGGKVRYWTQVFQAVHWGAWMGPLAAWMVFVAAAYGLFYSLTYVALGYWVRREKLIFPLAQLPEQLLPEEGGQSRLPRTLRSSGFWAAFALVFLIWSWNGGVAAEWIPGLGEIPLGMNKFRVEAIVGTGIFQGLTGGTIPLSFLIIFTAIGVAFLLPTEISFSMWFYFLVGKAIILLLVWFGHGQSGDDFPTDFFGQANPVTAQGGGALLMFAAISLGRALLDFLQLTRGKPGRQKLRLGLPVIGLAVSLVVFYGWLVWADLGLLWAGIVTAVLTLMTMGLMRVVAEGGIYWFQLHLSPMHLYKTLGLGSLGGGLLKFGTVPFIPIYAVLFFDLKTFMAPNLANAAKLQEDTAADRGKYHLNIILCLVVSVTVAIGFALFLAHLIGAQQMNSWFYSSGPQWLLNHAQRLPEAEAAFDPATTAAYALGGGWVALSLFVRRTLFGFPHPIGYVMLANPLMASLWFSFFLGWIAKKLVVQYGGKQTFEQLRPVFIGLILGELMAVLVWAILGIAFDFAPDVTLNRHP